MMVIWNLSSGFLR